MKDFIYKVKREDILNSEYVLISSSLRNNRSFSNVASIEMLYPCARISSIYLSSGNDDEFVSEYYHQLESKDCKYVIATILKYGLEHKNVIIMNSEADSRLPYMDILIEFVKNEFGYPFISYKKFIKGKISDKEVKYNEDKVRKTIDDIIYHMNVKMLRSTFNIKDVKDVLQTMSKKEIKRYAKKDNIYIYLF